ncbi:MAG: 50S ribosomal protein L19e [Nitrososphaerales archaeon]
MPINLRYKRELAARTLGVGANRIKFEPEFVEDVLDAITRDDIRSLVTARTIYVAGKRGTSRGRARERHLKNKKHGKGQGSKKGRKTARQGRKENWVKKVRAMRRHIKILKKRGEISGKAFWTLYTKINGGQVRSLSHLRELVKEVTSA